jgi:hypothetical protein
MASKSRIGRRPRHNKIRVNTQGSAVAQSNTEKPVVETWSTDRLNRAAKKGNKGASKPKQTETVNATAPAQVRIPRINVTERTAGDGTVVRFVKRPKKS